MRALLGLLLVGSALGAPLTNGDRPLNADTRGWQDPRTSSPTVGPNQQNRSEPFHRAQLGTGAPAKGATHGSSQGDYLADGLYHVPQYLPGHPTAATIWPRVVEVACEVPPPGGRPVAIADPDRPLLIVEGVNREFTDCAGYHWTPALGRAEYLYVVPRAKAPSAPVLVEVPVRKKRE